MVRFGGHDWLERNYGANGTAARLFVSVFTRHPKE